MQIDNNKIFSKWFNEVKEVKNNTPQESTHIYPKKAERDSISVSEDALDIHRFMSMLSTEDDIRYEKVDEINKKIKEDTYHISAKDVVAKLLGGK